MERVLPSFGLYRHFKGSYYYLQSIAKDSLQNGSFIAIYFNVCHPEYGLFTRPCDDWLTDVSNHGGNVTGQPTRFVEVKDLDFQVKTLTTEQLINELRSREDSPIHTLDLEGLASSVYSTDYVVGKTELNPETLDRGVTPLATFEKEIDARKFFLNHVVTKRTKLFKRTFIELEP